MIDVIRDTPTIRENSGYIRLCDFRKNFILSPIMAVSFYLIKLLQHLEIKNWFKINRMCVFDTFNNSLETVLHQLHKSIYTYLIQNKKKAAVLLILYQRFILKSNRRHFPSLQFTSSQINFCNSPLVYRFYTQQKYKAYKTSL